jgi:hypothetical protein
VAENRILCVTESDLPSDRNLFDINALRLLEILILTNSTSRLNESFQSEYDSEELELFDESEESFPVVFL